MVRKHPLRLGTPLAPLTAHAIAQYNVSPRPSFIAMHAIQYWQWQYRVKAKLECQRGARIYTCTYYIYSHTLIDRFRQIDIDGWIDR